MGTRKNNSYTSIAIEEGLGKLKDELNPFYNGHISKWGIKRKHPEKIGEMMGRWEERISSSKLVNEEFELLQNEYFEKIKLEDKQTLIDKHIQQYSKYRINGQATNLEEGYTNKGFRWFEEKKDFSLMDFILYHPETASGQVCDEAVKIISFPIITDTLIENAPKQELFFCYACEGYAFAKYVAFLKEQQNGKKDPLTKKIQFKSLCDIFIDKNKFTNSVKALVTLNVIDKKNNNLIGTKFKGVIQVWLDILKNNRHYIKSVKESELTVLLNKHFSGLELSEKTDGKHLRNPINKTASKQYRAKIIALIK